MTGESPLPGSPENSGVQAAAARAVDLIPDGARVGLGSGRAASAFIERLGDRVRQGLRVTAVPTSAGSARLARTVGIPLIELGEEWDLDLTVDGADEVAPNLDLLKGRGGAMVRERIVAAASKRLIILVGREKLVRVLGEHGPLPIEVIPFALGPVVRKLKRLGLAPVVRVESGVPLLSENGNVTLDSTLSASAGDRGTLSDLAVALLAVPGVVDVGLFLDSAERVLVGHPDGRVETLMRGDP